jgi:uncharacterized protein (DUF983 family)
MSFYCERLICPQCGSSDIFYAPIKDVYYCKQCSWSHPNRKVFISKFVRGG